MWIWIIVLGLIAYAIIEVWLVLLIGGMLGSALTMIWLIGGVIFGLAMLRFQGVRLLLRIDRDLKAQLLPIKPLINLVFVIAGACLVVLPGFLGDAMGFVLLFPPLRWVVTTVLSRRLFPLLPPVTVHDLK